MLKLVYIGGLGMMAGPGGVHLSPAGPAQVMRFHDRGKAGEERDKFRTAWRNHGAQPVASFDELIGDGEIDGVVICAGKNGDDIGIVAEITVLLEARCNQRPFILHLSTVNPCFAETAYRYCNAHGVDYANYPLTGGPLGAQLGGADPKGMLILASGDQPLYDRLLPMLERLGHPRFFGTEVSAGSITKLIGHYLVFNGLTGIGTGAVLHAEYFNEGVLGGEAQSDYLSFLNGGAGSTRQWDVALSKGIKDNQWDAGFNNRHAVVDIVYAIQLALDKGLPRMVIQPMINMAFVMSYLMLRYPGKTLATQAVVRELLGSEARELDCHMQGAGAFGSDMKQVLADCIASLPGDVRDTVLISPSITDFESAMTG
ncbi:MAG: NAD(P)-binding domain-containing protein [Candidatus Sedimenticola sp. PURPLELP]